MSKKIIIVNYIVLTFLFLANISLLIYFMTTNNTASIYDKNILKVVEIRVSDNETDWGYATAFFINDSGTLLTNKHVVYNKNTNTYYNKIQIRTPLQDDWQDAEIQNASESDDLATIKTNLTGTKFFRLETNYNNGDTIYTIGNPNGFGLSFTEGLISSDERIVIYNEQSIKTIQTSLVINEGNSGGPVFNKKGKLVGIISFRLKDKYNDVIQGVSFILPSTTINSFLKG